MNKIYCIVLLLIAGITLSAQTYESVMGGNLWNDGDNIAAIRLDNRNISVAGVVGKYEGGDFKTYNQSQYQYTAGVEAKSIKHFDKFSVNGQFAFSDTEAEQMKGSMFLDTDFFPVDVIETTPGHKQFQSYEVKGGVSVDLSDKWKIGAATDFNARNASKLKDLRYSSYRLDLKVAPSILYVGEKFSFGASMVYKRNAETINASQIGSAESAPFAFFDKGLYIGNYQVWTGNGVHLKESGVSGLPARQDIFGGALQFGSETFYLDLYAGWLKGKIGEKQTIWYRYNGPQARARLSFVNGHSTVRAVFEWNRTINRESVQDKITEGGVAVVKEYEGNTVFRRNTMSIGVDYEYSKDNYSIFAVCNLSDFQRMTTPVYPFVYTRDLKNVDIGVGGKLKWDKWLVNLNVTYSKGFATDNDWLADESVAPETAPFRYESLYKGRCNYETVDKIATAFVLDRQITKSLHLTATGRCLVGVKYIDGKTVTRNTVTLGLSYIF